MAIPTLLSATPGPSRLQNNKSPVRRQTSSNIIEIAQLRSQLRQLQSEKQAAILQVQELQKRQQSSSTFLQQTAAQVQNTHNVASEAHAALSADTQTALNQLASMIQNGFKQSSQTFDTMRVELLDQRALITQQHTELSQRMDRLEQRTTMLERRAPAPPERRLYPFQPSAGTIPAPPPTRPYQLLEALTAAPQPQYTNGVAGKAPTPGKFGGDRDLLAGWLLQLEEYFNITLTRNEGQRLAYVSLCLMGKALEWWRPNKTKFRTWEEAQAGFRLYYGDRYKKHRSHQELLALVQTGPIQDYLTEADRLNAYAGIPDDQRISIILPRLRRHLCTSMAHYENLQATPVQWRQKLVEMDVSIREVQAITRPTGSSHRQPEQQNRKRSEERRVGKECVP